MAGVWVLCDNGTESVPKPPAGFGFASRYTLCPYRRAHKAWCHRPRYRRAVRRKGTANGRAQLAIWPARASAMGYRSIAPALGRYQRERSSGSGKTKARARFESRRPELGYISRKALSVRLSPHIMPGLNHSKTAQSTTWYARTFPAPHRNAPGSRLPEALGALQASSW